MGNGKFFKVKTCKINNVNRDLKVQSNGSDPRSLCCGKTMRGLKWL